MQIQSYCPNSEAAARHNEGDDFDNISKDERDKVDAAESALARGNSMMLEMQAVINACDDLDDKDHMLKSIIDAWHDQPCIAAHREQYEFITESDKWLGKKPPYFELDIQRRMKVTSEADIALRRMLVADKGATS